MAVNVLGTTLLRSPLPLTLRPNPGARVPRLLLERVETLLLRVPMVPVMPLSPPSRRFLFTCRVPLITLIIGPLSDRQAAALVH